MVVVVNIHVCVCMSDYIIFGICEFNMHIMCMYVCMYVYVYVYVHVCMCICVYVYMCMCNILCTNECFYEYM